nr:ATP-binding protein [Deinobacterium chartae]
MHLEATAAHLAALGAFVRSALPGTTSGELDLIDLAVTELAVNALQHGGARRWSLTVGAAVQGACIVFEDDGQPFDPRAVTPGTAGELRAGGYGLLIVRRVARQLSYARRGPLNRTTLLF